MTDLWSCALDVEDELVDEVVLYVGRALRFGAGAAVGPAAS